MTSSPPALAARSATATDPAPATRPAAILAIILAGYFMILPDASVIFTALPSLQAGLDLSAAQPAAVARDSGSVHRLAPHPVSPTG
jgi:hypothetical protein